MSLRNGFSEHDISSGLSSLLLYIELRPVPQEESMLKQLIQKVTLKQKQQQQGDKVYTIISAEEKRKKNLMQILIFRFRSTPIFEQQYQL